MGELLLAMSEQKMLAERAMWLLVYQLCYVTSTGKLLVNIALRPHYDCVHTAPEIPYTELNAT